MRWFISLFIISNFILSWPADGRAATEFESHSKIVAVTVFPSRAEVQRAVELRLPAGQSTLVLNDLPASLIPQSLRVRGDAEGTMRIGSVETTTQFTGTAVREDERRLIAELEALNDQKRVLDDRIAAARLQFNFVTAIGREGPKLLNQQMAEGRFDAQALSQAIGLIGRGASDAHDAIRTAGLDKRALERKAVKIQQRLNQVRTGRRSSLTARINLETDQPITARLELSYQLPGASWRPLYDARLDTKSGETQLIHIGEVRQRTGEDWSEVRLTLSTARPSMSASLPELQPWFIDVRQPGHTGDYKTDLERSKSELSGLRDSLTANKELHAPEPAADEARSDTDPISAQATAQVTSKTAPIAAAPITADVLAGEFAARYVIPGTANLPSDSRPQKFVVSQRSFDAKLSVHTVPKITAQAYLAAEINYDGAAPLLPGPVSVFRDGAFVGTSAIAMLRPGEQARLSFGVDDKVRVTYRFENGQRSREGLINKHQRLERRYLIEVTNHHEREMDITVFDQLPVPQDETIEVALLRSSTKASETDVEGRKGVLAWRDSYAAGEKRTIKFGYAITHPEGQGLLGF